MSTRDRNTLLLAFAWLVAIAATAGSLYYSQIRHFIPCE
ncbi:MAG TPA: disulfide bond formation protein B, partial [Oceanithermus profundus]|nr:disulfide bond formation protein B [Oceanithermus profundus]